CSEPHRDLAFVGDDELPRADQIGCFDSEGDARRGQRRDVVAGGKRGTRSDEQEQERERAHFAYYSSCLILATIASRTSAGEPFRSSSSMARATISCRRAARVASVGCEATAERPIPAK